MPFRYFFKFFLVDIVSFFILFLWALPVDASSNYLDLQYEIDATVSAQEVQGTAMVSFRYQGEAEQDSFLFLLYPNRYETIAPEINDLNYFRIYPTGFNPGSMTVEVNTGRIRRLPREEFPGHAFASWTPEEPVEPGELVQVKMSFHTRIPEKFGTFGAWRRVMLVSGGWYPMLVNDQDVQDWSYQRLLLLANYKVTLSAPKESWVILDDQVFSPGVGIDAPDNASERLVVVDAKNRSGMFLCLAKRLVEYRRDGIRLLLLKRDLKRARRVLDVMEDVRNWLSLRGIALPDKDVVILEGYLTRELTFGRATLPVVSFRTYKLWTPLKRYHDLHVARAYLVGALREKISSRELPGDGLWIQEGIGWELAELYMSQKGSPRDPRDYLRHLSWISAVDMVLYGERFPFVAEYYGNFYWSDPLRDDVSRYGHQTFNGHVAFEKLKDLIGVARVEELINHYLKSEEGSGGLEVVAESVAQRDLDAFFRQWRSSPPHVNYRVEGFESVPDEDRWNTKIAVKRVGDLVDGPVEVEVRAGPEQKILEWNPEGGTELIEVESVNPVESVQLDPRGRLWEQVRWDNQEPRAWKWVLQYFYLDVDFKIGKPSAGAGFEFQRTWDPRNELDTRFFWTQESKGGAVGYVRSFGPPTWYRGLLHRFGAFLVVERLNNDFARNGVNVIPGFDPNASEVDMSLGLDLGYRYDSRLDFRWPQHGSRASFWVEGGVGLPNRTSPYFLWSSHLVHLIPFTPRSVLALQSKAGAFFATHPRGVPLPKLFFMGGIQDLRGMSEPEVVGPARLLFSAEWRWYLLRHLDWNFWFLRVRGLQPSFFVDAGTVTPGALVIPSLKQWYSDAGLALRTHFDFLGVRPMVLRIDLAQRTDTYLRDQGVADVRLYLGMGQSF